MFTLQASGESMINVGIYDGDFVIIQKQKVAKNGEIVAALTEDNEVTLKTFYKDCLPEIPVAQPRHKERHQRTEPVEQTIGKIGYCCHAKHG